MSISSTERSQIGKGELSPHSELKEVQPITTVRSKTGTLCLEIGGTRIKACVVEDICSYTELQGVQTFATDTQLFLSKNRISDIFKRIVSNPLLPCLERALYSTIAVSIKGSVTSDGVFRGDKIYDVSKDRLVICQEQGISAFSIHNDAVCWAAGAIAYQTMKKHPVAFPCLAITLGTVKQ